MICHINSLAILLFSPPSSGSFRYNNLAKWSIHRPHVITRFSFVFYGNFFNISIFNIAPNIYVIQRFFLSFSGHCSSIKSCTLAKNCCCLSVFFTNLFLFVNVFSVYTLVYIFRVVKFTLAVSFRAARLHEVASFSPSKLKFLKFCEGIK